MSALLLTALVLAVLEPSDSMVIDTIDYGVSGLSLIGVFGYAYSRAIATRTLWRVLLPVVIAWDGSMLIRQYLDPEIGKDFLTFAVIVLVGDILVVPTYVAVFRYGYKNSVLWSNRI